MFPLPILTYIKLGAAVAALLLAMYLGYSFEHSRFVDFKATIIAEKATIEKDYQAKAAKIESEKNAQIRNINSQLVDAISELRKRPGRATETSVGQVAGYCTGSQLYAEDAELVTREAARADTIRVALKACYLQYDAIK
tara:strand:- start:2428 stop:2844 length:417 start_codon:yes stop_codon:yes gene_type:complete